MLDVRERFRDADAIPAPALWSEIVERASAPETVVRVQMPRRRRGPALAVGLVAAAVVLAVLVWTIRSSETDRVPATPSSWSVGARIPVGNTPTSVVSAGGSLWVSTLDGVVRVDPATGDVSAPLDVGRTGLAADGEGNLWARLNSALVRIDPATGVASVPIRLPNVADAPIAAGFGSAWSGEYKGSTVRRVERDGTVVSIETGGFFPIDIEITEDAVWVVSLDGTVQRIDPATNEITLDVPAGDQLPGSVFAYGLVTDDGSVSMLACADATEDRFGMPRGCSWTLVRIDADTGRIVGTFALGKSEELTTSDGVRISNDTMNPLLARDGEVWLAVNDYVFHGVGDPYTIDQGEHAGIRDSAILRVDGETGEVLQRIRVGGASLLNGTELDGSVWVVDIGNGDLIRVDPGADSNGRGAP